MDTSVDKVIALSYRSVRAQLKLETLGAWITRYGLVAVLLLIGLLKFTAAEAAGIQPLVAHSPLMSWMYGRTSRSTRARRVSLDWPSETPAERPRVCCRLDR